MEHPGSKFAYLVHDLNLRNGLINEADRRHLSQLEPSAQHQLAGVPRGLQTIAAQLADGAAHAAVNDASLRKWNPAPILVDLHKVAIKRVQPWTCRPASSQRLLQSSTGPGRCRHPV